MSSRLGRKKAQEPMPGVPEPDLTIGVASGFAEVEAMRRNHYQVVKSAPRNEAGQVLAGRKQVSPTKACESCGATNRPLSADRLSRWSCDRCDVNALVHLVEDEG